MISQSFDDKPKIGIVKDGAKLIIHEKPDFKSYSVCSICSGERVMIDDEESTDHMYKVFTEIGIEGFCDKNFIRIEEGGSNG